MDLLEFLADKKCPVTKTYVAERLFTEHKNPAITFHNKLHGVQGRKFSQDEKEKIISILKSLGIELSKLTID